MRTSPRGTRPRPPGPRPPGPQPLAWASFQYCLASASSTIQTRGFPSTPPRSMASRVWQLVTWLFHAVANVCRVLLLGWATLAIHYSNLPWPWLRTASWLIGIAVVIWCTNAGISVYAQVSVGLPR